TNLVLIARDNISIDFDLTLLSIDAHSGNHDDNGPDGNIAIGAVVIAAKKQDYWAGDPTQTTNSHVDVNAGANFKGTGLGATSPAHFSLRQDDSWTDNGGSANLPAMGQFGAGIPADYSNRSDHGSVTIKHANTIGSGDVALQGKTGGDLVGGV